MFGAKHQTFDPTAVQTMADALDEAWAINEENDDAEHDPQETRLGLARRIIELASHRDYNTSTLRDAALAGLTLRQSSSVQH